MAEMEEKTDVVLMRIIAWSNPDGPNEREARAYDLLIERGYSPRFIDQQTQRIRLEAESHL
jgi:hypothetical protein